MTPKSFIVAITLAGLVGFLGFFLPTAWVQSSACGDGISCGIQLFYILPIVAAGTFATCTALLALRSVRLPFLYAWAALVVPISVQFAAGSIINTHDLRAVAIVAATSIAINIAIGLCVRWLITKLPTVPLVIVGLLLPLTLFGPWAYRITTQDSLQVAEQKTAFQNLPFKPLVHPSLEPIHLVTTDDGTPDVHIQYDNYTVDETYETRFYNGVDICKHVVASFDSSGGAMPECVNKGLARDNSPVAYMSGSYYTVLGNVALVIVPYSQNGNDATKPDDQQVIRFINDLQPVDQSTINPVIR